MTRNLFLYFLAALMTLTGPVGLGRRTQAAPLRAPLETLTIPLVRYNGKNGNSVYAAQPKYRNLFEQASKNWEKFGTVGHVYPQKIAGTVPLLSLRKKAEVGIAPNYYYTTSIDEAVAKQNAGWVMVPEYKGVTGYVATSAKPGTIAVYRYKQPAGPGYLYAFGEQENNALKETSAKFQKIAFYVWGEPVESEPVKGSSFPTANDTVDLSLRKDVYFNGSNTVTLDRNGSYGSPTAPLTIKRNKGSECEGNVCTYNLGFIIFRNAGKGSLSVYAGFSGSSIGSIGNTYIFKAGQTIREVILPVRLPLGQHVIKAAVDPSNKISESNDANNSFSVTVNIVP